MSAKPIAAGSVATAAATARASGSCTIVGFMRSDRDIASGRISPNAPLSSGRAISFIGRRAHALVRPASSQVRIARVEPGASQAKVQGAELELRGGLGLFSDVADVVREWGRPARIAKD